MNVCGNWNVEGEDKEECRRVERVGVGGTVRERCSGPETYQAGEVTSRGRRTWKGLRRHQWQGAGKGLTGGRRGNEREGDIWEAQVAMGREETYRRHNRQWARRGRTGVTRGNEPERNVREAQVAMRQKGAFRRHEGQWAGKEPTGGTNGNELEGGVQEARGALSQKGTYRVLLEILDAREKEMASGRHSKALGRQKFFADQELVLVLDGVDFFSISCPLAYVFIQVVCFHTFHILLGQIFVL